MAPRLFLPATPSFGGLFSSVTRCAPLQVHCGARRLRNHGGSISVEPRCSYQITGDAKAVLFILLIVIVVLLLGGGGGFYGRRAGWGQRGFGGLLVTVLIVVLLIWAVNELMMPPLPMPAGAPSIIR